jgi:hypothetical protein
MFIVLWPFMACISIFFMILTYVLAPLLTLFSNSYGILPKYLYWFQTFDNTLDAGWKIQGNYGTYLQNGLVPTGFTLYKYRVFWLWRNPGYGFDYWPLGLSFDKTQWNTPKTTSSGNWQYWTGSNGRFCIKWVPTTFLGMSVCPKVGWKVWAYWDSTNNQWQPDNYSWGPTKRIPICLSQ